MQSKDIPTTCNEHYDLISVLYHALEGAWKCETYHRDAEKAGDQTLAQFFRETQQEECAGRAGKGASQAPYGRAEQHPLTGGSYET